MKLVDHPWNIKSRFETLFDRLSVNIEKGGAVLPPLQVRQNQEKANNYTATSVCSLRHRHIPDTCLAQRYEWERSPLNLLL